MPAANLSSVQAPWLDSRSAGILLHPTALPGDQGIGVLDGAVDHLLDFLGAAGIRNWQICPLGPTGFGDSPYQCFSAFAGNPYLIDLWALVDLGLLTKEDVAPLQLLSRDRVDYGALDERKLPALFKAHQRSRSNAHGSLPYGNFVRFKETHRDWLEAFCLFRALKDELDGLPWWEWPEEVRFFEHAAGSPLAAKVAERADAHAFLQYLFFGQWERVRSRARELNIRIIGDAPIFVARDSADVWKHPELFLLDRANGQPQFVAGVPPDYFSADGQLWGNPLYDWPAHAAEGYDWWIRRLRTNFLQCDILRIDHFRGFDRYWAIPAKSTNARTGTWEPGPGPAIFEAIRAALPEARLIAEDLGELTPSVTELRLATGLPGMAILQFAFGGDATNPYLPHNLAHDCAVYPGTHDNDTTLGWFQALPEKDRDHIRRYFRISGHEIAWDFIRAAYASVCHLAIIPLQDFLNLGSEARFNTPGKAEGNWHWRVTADQLERLHRESAGYLRELAALYGR